MQKVNGCWIFSPSDLCVFWESEFASWMDHFVKETPDAGLKRDDDDELQKTLQQRGNAHELRILETFKASGLRVTEIAPCREMTVADDATIEALRTGADVIFQGRLTRGQFSGLADFLIKVPGRSKLGDYHYEIWDTKLSGRLKPYFLLQLCAYADYLAELQGCLAESIVVVLGNGEQRRLRTADYFAYYSCLKSAFTSYHANFDAALMPDPGRSFSLRHWSQYGTALLEARDGLSQVARISKTQIKNLEAAGICTMSQLAASNLSRVPKMKEEVFGRLHHQASLQVASKGRELPMLDILPHHPQKPIGLCALPPHSDSDVFFDMEGFPLVDGGLEYLWGSTYLEEGQSKFLAFWAHNRDEEQAAFEGFMDWAYARWQHDPSMHIYHYASYEVTAIRRMMGRFGSREDQVDQLLRHEVFVDLYSVVRNGLRIGAPSYSIKTVEHFYRGKRSGDVTDAGTSVIFYELWLQTREQSVLDSIRDYNKDDCDSTQELAIWLRGLQKQHRLSYVAPSRALPEEDDAEGATGAEGADAITLTLTTMAKAQPELSTLAWLVDFHRREQKPQWWRYFDRLKMSEDELNDDIECLAGLERSATTPLKVARSFVHEFNFDPVQECKLGPNKKCTPTFDPKLKLEIINIDLERGICEVKAGPKVDLPDRMHLIPDDIIHQGTLVKGVRRYAQSRVGGTSSSQAIDDFLARRRPRIIGAEYGPIVAAESDITAAAVQAVINLDGSTLSIQGPPGAGKSYTASHIILALVKAGRRVGIASNSHKAVNHLMAGAFARIRDAGINCRVVKIGGDEDDASINEGIEYCDRVKNLKITDSLMVIGGTAFAMAHEAMIGQLDTLFIDEAGQVSIANLVAMGGATRNIVLMGDQMQLGQPVQGSHPGESGLSLLEYLLEGRPTIPDDMGIFLPRTYRLHPKICRFISEMIYDGRLDAAPDTERQRIVCPSSPGPISAESGLIFIPVAHEGNSQASDEEVAKIQELATSIVGRTFIDKKGQERILTLEDILFVAPYNFQVRKLKSALGHGAKVGSVDKFQGQEAPVVILSMCASTMEGTSGRGIEFVFSKNRLNVAITRAQALAIVVGNPALAHAHVTTIEQMAQVNLFCRLIDFAQG